MNKSPQINLPIFIGYRCNYSCQHCSAGSDFIKNTDFDPTLEEILSSIPVLAEKFDVQHAISLTGGEPLLYWDEKVIPIIFKIREHFPKTTINIITNGQLIGKNIDKIFNLIDQITNISFTISQHLVGDLNSSVGQKWQSSVNALISHPSIIKIHEDHYHVKDNIQANIYFYRGQGFWSSHYVHQDNGQIKPHATNDPINSMKHGCIGNQCSYLDGTKLYKCGRLANLRYILKTTNQLEDPDWQKYLDYQPLDLLNLNQHDLNKFLETYTKPIDVCDMCENRQPALKWNNRTWNMVFTKRIPLGPH